MGSDSIIMLFLLSLIIAHKITISPSKYLGHYLSYDANNDSLISNTKADDSIYFVIKHIEKNLAHILHKNKFLVYDPDSLMLELRKKTDKRRNRYTSWYIENAMDGVAFRNKQNCLEYSNNKFAMAPCKNDSNQIFKYRIINDLE